MKKNFDLFDFTSFFLWTLNNFLAHCAYVNVSVYKMDDQMENIVYTYPPTTYKSFPRLVTPALDLLEVIGQSEAHLSDLGL